MENELKKSTSQAQPDYGLNPVFPPPPQQMSYPAPDSPLKCQIESKLKLSLLVLSTIAISFAVGTITLNLSYVFESLYDSGLSALINNLVTLSFNFFIGRYIYKNNVGTAVFMGLLYFSGTVASTLASGIVSPAFLFSMDPSGQSMTEFILSDVLKAVFSVAVVLLFNRFTEKQNDYQGEITENYPKNPPLYMFLLYLVSGLLISIPLDIIGMFTSFVETEGFYNSAMPAQAFNNFLPLLSALLTFFQIIIYYFMLKRRYGAHNKTLGMLSIFYLSTALATPFLSLCILAQYLISNFVTLDELVVNLIFNSLLSIVMLVGSIIFIVLLTKKLEPKIRNA